jgi:hypothetical protein
MSEKSLSDAIIEAICKQNLSAYALGKMADVSPVVISRFMAGERGLTLATADKITRALNLRLCEGSPERPLDPVSEAATGPNEVGTDESSPKQTTLNLDEQHQIVLNKTISIRLVNLNGRSVRLAVDGPTGMVVRRGEAQAPTRGNPIGRM